MDVFKKSPTVGPTFHGPRKNPEYLIARSQLTERGPLGFGPIQFLMECTVPTKTQLSNFLRTPGEDYLKGNPKSLNFYFLVIWWGKCMFQRSDPNQWRVECTPDPKVPRKMGNPVL